MKCLRIFATPDGESHFGEVDIPTTLRDRFRMERLPLTTNPRVPLSTKPREFVLVISLQGRAKRTFITHRVDSLPFGWMARSSLKRATER